MGVYGNPKNAQPGRSNPPKSGKTVGTSDGGLPSKGSKVVK